jgi:hypothetical protein
MKHPEFSTNNFIRQCNGKSDQFCTWWLSRCECETMWGEATELTLDVADKASIRPNRFSLAQYPDCFTQQLMLMIYRVEDQKN